MPTITQKEKDRIRQEIRYALAVIEGTKEKKHVGAVGKFFLFMNNGIILLLVGSLITSFLVPYFQRQHEERKYVAELKRDVFSQFLLYTNSIWKEYYLMFPLVHESSISKDEYNKYLKTIGEIKLERYGSYSKLLGPAIIFRENDQEPSSVERTLKEYAIKVNSVSFEIDRWLRHLYCASTQCMNEESLDPFFTSPGAFNKIAESMQSILIEGENVSRVIASYIGKGEVNEH